MSDERFIVCSGCGSRISERDEHACTTAKINAGLAKVGPLFTEEEAVYRFKDKLDSQRVDSIDARIAAAIHAERKHIATALRTVADRFGGPVKAALEQVAREVFNE